MYEIIKNIFIESEFELNESIYFDDDLETNFIFFSRTTNNKFDFYLVANYKEDEVTFNNLIGQLDRCFEEIILGMNVPGIEKNLSFLLLLETESINLTKEQIKFIYNLEEDPYDFKKYVLTYTLNQVEILKKYIENNNGSSLIKRLNSILQDEKLFASFKKKRVEINSDERQIDLLYDLVSKIFIKLPFLSLDVMQKTPLNLRDEINSSLNKTQSEIVKLIFEQHSFDPDLNIKGILDKLGVDYVE